MRRVVAALLAALPFDPRSRRTLDETLLDWAHEEPGLTRRFARVRVGLRALVSVVRSVAGTAMWEAVRVPPGWLAARLVMFVALPSLVLTLVRDGLSGLAVRSAQPHWIERDALLWLQVALLAAPVALFVSVALTPRARRLPAVGLSVLTLLGVLAGSGWLVPWASQRDRIVSYAVRSGVDIEAAAQFVTRASDRGAARQMVLEAGLGALGLFLVLLGAAVRELTGRKKVSSVVVVVLIYTISFGSLPLVEAFASHAHPIVSVAPWCLTACSMFVLALLSDRPDRRFA